MPWDSFYGVYAYNGDGIYGYNRLYNAMGLFYGIYGYNRVYNVMGLFQTQLMFNTHAFLCDKL